MLDMKKFILAYSFFSGSYGTFWGDWQHLFLQNRFFNDRGITMLTGLLALALLPTALFVCGIWKSIGKSSDKEASNYNGLLVSALANLALSLEAYTLLSYRLPHWSIVKSFYLLYIMAPLALLFAEGIKAFTKRAGWTVITVWCVALSILSVYCFTY